MWLRQDRSCLPLTFLKRYFVIKSSLANVPNSNHSRSISLTGHFPLSLSLQLTLFTKQDRFWRMSSEMSLLRRKQVLVFCLGWLSYASTYLLRKPLGVVCNLFHLFIIFLIFLLHTRPKEVLKCHFLSPFY